MNDITKKETETALTAANTVGGEDILSSSIIIPKLLLMQGLSEFVNDRKAQQGDMVRSTTGEKLGDLEVPVEFIPLTFTNTWILNEKIGGKFEYRGQEPMTAKNQDLPWEFKKDGADWRRIKSLNVYALLPKDIRAEAEELKKAASGEMPDPDKALLPVMISFRSTGYSAGKSISTHFAKAKTFGLKGYVSVMKLKCYQEKNDKGAFYVFSVENAGKTLKEDLVVCEKWYTLLTSQNVNIQVDESEDLVSTVVPDDQY